jgi:hypothetical protein
MNSANVATEYSRNTPDGRINFSVGLIHHKNLLTPIPERLKSPLQILLKSFVSCRNNVRFVMDYIVIFQKHFIGD